MKYIVTLKGKDYEILVEESEVELLGITESAPVQAAAAKSSPAVSNASAPPAPAEGGAVPAPMPGVILELKKAAGDSVKKGETVLIIEAMKMENEITAPADGTISAIFCLKGASVNTGDSLFAIQ